MDIREVKNFDKFSFGNFIRERREILGISVRGLAFELGISPAYLCDLEKGYRKAPLGNERIMSTLVNKLCINQEEEEQLAIMALATREFNFSFLK